MTELKHCWHTATSFEKENPGILRKLNENVDDDEHGTARLPKLRCRTAKINRTAVGGVQRRSFFRVFDEFWQAKGECSIPLLYIVGGSPRYSDKTPFLSSKQFLQRRTKTRAALLCKFSSPPLSCPGHMRTLLERCGCLPAVSTLPNPRQCPSTPTNTHTHTQKWG